MSIFSPAKKPEDRNITLPIKKVILGFLGQGYWESRPIDKESALLIHTVLKNETLAYVQFEDEDTLKELDEPILWNYNSWINSCEKRSRARARSEAYFKDCELRDYNIKLVIPCLSEYTGIPEDRCYNQAYKIVTEKKYKILKIMGFKGELKEKL